MAKTEMSSPPEMDKSQRDSAYHALRRLLILQQVRDGERLREPVWAKRLGVNRMALREAFARLEAEGLIERGPKTGYFTPTLSEQDIHEILIVRAALEATAIEGIVRGKRNTRRQLEPLNQAIEELQSMIERNYILGASEADRRFHERLVELAGNRRLTMIYQRAPLPMIHRPIVDTPHWEAEMQRTLEEHRQIVAFLLKGETLKAQQAIRSHLSDRYLQSIDGAK